MCGPGGKRSNLPKQFDDCDENTIQGDSIIVQPNGSFSEADYTSTGCPARCSVRARPCMPICDATHQCVLYVGENQNDFTKPKVFSEPFTVTGRKGT